MALAAGGDPRRIRRLAVRFAGYAFPGEELAVSVYDDGTTSEGLHSYAFEVASEGRTVLRHGRVEVASA